MLLTTVYHHAPHKSSSLLFLTAVPHNGPSQLFLTVVPHYGSSQLFFTSFVSGHRKK
jgi:hypothetical protein